MVLLAKEPANRLSRRQNQVLSKAEEEEFGPEVEAAKVKEIGNYCTHKAIHAVLRTGQEWNILTAIWVLTFKWADGAWMIKARLCLRGFQDRQGPQVHKYSPTASRLGQRLLQSTAVLYRWELISIDVSAAFLQGLPFKDATTKLGQQRRAWCTPPADAWRLLRLVKDEFGLELPAIGFESHWIWLLLKAIYGLDDAPLLWRKALMQWLLGKGWTESRMDRCMLYLREDGLRKGPLRGLLTLHIDDEGATGFPEVLETLASEMSKQYGEVKLQKDMFRHIGHELRQTWGLDGSVTLTDSQEFYTETIAPVDIPVGVAKATLLNEPQKSDLRRLNGEMSYGNDCRPDAMGRIALSLQSMDENAAVEHLHQANAALEILQDPVAVKHLTFMPKANSFLRCPRFKFYLLLSF